MNCYHSLNSTVESIDDLPGVLTAAEWRSLEERLEYSTSRRAFLLRPPRYVQGPVPGEAQGRDEVEYATAPGVRPGTFAEIIGQERVVESLVLAVRTAMDRGEAMGRLWRRRLRPPRANFQYAGATGKACLLDRSRRPTRDR